MWEVSLGSWSADWLDLGVELVRCGRAGAGEERACSAKSGRECDGRWANGRRASVDGASGWMGTPGPLNYVEIQL